MLGVGDDQLGRVLGSFLEFRFQPRGIGKVLSDFKEATLWGAGENASNVEGPPGSR